MADRPDKDGELEERYGRWREDSYEAAAQRGFVRKEEFLTSDGAPTKPLYMPWDAGVESETYMEDLGFPGEYPFTRGVQATMYRGRPWTCLLYTSPSPRDATLSRMPSSA